MRNAIRKCRQLIVCKAQLDQPSQAADWRRKQRKRVLAEVEIPQLLQERDGLWQRLQTIVVQIEEIAEACDLAKALRKQRELIVTEVEGAQPAQVSDLF